jgi:hydroxymethylglutaryl-CoA lyase
LQVFLSLKIYGANKIIECPRDAMQGIKPFIPTERKVAYIQSLLRVGFDSIDFGSFVSPKAIPQMQDTAAVLGQLICRKQKQTTGYYCQYQRWLQHAEIQYLGYPFSISKTFRCGILTKPLQSP